MRLDETQRETIKHKVIMPMCTTVVRIKFLLSNGFRSRNMRNNEMVNNGSVSVKTPFNISAQGCGV